MRKILCILLCMLLLSACGNTNVTSGIKEKDTSIKKEDTNIKESNEKENKIVTPLESFKVGEKYMDSPGLLAVENGIYYFSYNTDSSWCYAKYGNGKMSDIYSIDNKYDIFYENIINGNLIIACYFKSKVTILKISMDGKEEIITNMDMPGFSVIGDAGNSIIWLDHEKVKNNMYKETLKIYDTNTGITKTTDIQCIYKRKNNYYTGNVIMCIGGWNDGFCYTVTKFKNELMYNDLSGKTEIYYYSFKEQKPEKLSDYQYKPSYICGAKETVVVSDYLVQGLEDTGKVLYTTGKEYGTKLLDGVNAADNIYKSYCFKDNNYIAFNDEYFWIFNTVKQTCQKYKFNHVYEGDFGKNGWKPCDHVTSRIVKDGDKCYYSVYNNPLMEIYQINIKNTDIKKAWN